MKKIVGCFFCMCMAVLMAVPAHAFEILPIAAENSTYEEVVSGIGSDAILSISDKTVREEVEMYLAENELTLVAISAKSIYVKQKTLADGSAFAVPMTEAEVSQMQANDTITPYAIVNPEAKEYGKLTITLIVSADARHQVIINTRASWGESKLFGDTKFQASGDDDTYTVTWGENEHLKARTASCSGKYRNGQTIQIYNTANGEKGTYSWHFREQKGGSEAEKVYSTITLAPAATPIGRTTWCEFTYVHTYLRSGDISGFYNLEWSLSIAASGLPY